MSRNICRTECRYCGSRVRLDEDPREILPAEAGAYFDVYRGMVVARATCPLCEALYLAWIRFDAGVEPLKKYLEQARVWMQDPEEGGPFVAGRVGPVPDLSFRSTFGDEPGPDDLPRWKIGKVRVGPWTEE